MRGLSLTGAQFVDQLVALKFKPALGVDGAAVDALSGFDQGDRDALLAVQDLPGERGPAFALGELKPRC